MKKNNQLKNFEKFGKAITREESKSITGGASTYFRPRCAVGPNGGCGAGQCCSNGTCYPIGTPGHLCDIVIGE
ncbi:hypothetical protein CLV51_1011336 [Chitinophaga niastensis]|uniref:Uncharacterized protein n=1 Tax=Chitinophaga niastensis TaxID=536980 RepID=A0A2P8HV08_CHINA|nr:hypothetical protein [Chitinophaga niastensis]PSL49994.1 hypothetical protein CLV51_1011336 [Chitinophaga niastensis]